MDILHHFLAENLVKETFHDKSLLESIWSSNWGVNNSVGKIKKVLVHRPGDEILQLRNCQYEPEANALILRNKDGRIQSYCRDEKPPSLAKLQLQHDRLTTILREAGAEVIQLKGTATEWTNRLFTRDVGMVIPGGIVLSRFALYLRQGETKMALQTLAEIGMPVFGTIQGKGFVEGGSFAFLNEKTALIGRSIRVNQEGIEQLRSILSWQNIELLVIDLPATKIHLDEAFMLVDRDKALVDPSLLPYWFLAELKDRGIQLIYLDPDDPPLTNNCLTIEPGKVVFAENGIKTIKQLTKHGIDIIPIDVSEIIKMGGGIHCSTLPLMRESI